MLTAQQLTVVIPTRERWAILARTLSALRAQTVSGFETIVVCDGGDQQPPAELREHSDVRFLIQEQAGPGAARNHGVRNSHRLLLLFLGDDMLPEPQLVQRHLMRHERDPGHEVAVLGHVRWHPEVARSRINRWLDWSGAQFDYRQLARERREEAGFGRFYSCNVSLGRELFCDAGGFDPVFTFDYEDLDLAWRLHQRGMRLLYEPGAVALHLHRHDWATLTARYQSRARGERLMAAKHEWFSPWFHARLSAHAEQPPVSQLWRGVVDLVPERVGRWRAWVEAKADRSYQQRLAPSFLAAWDAERELEELRAYLGDAYEHERLVQHRRLVDEEAAAIGNEERFYRSSQLYLYDLTAFAMSGAKDPYRAELKALLRPGARVLDYGCGIGSDGLRLLEEGYRVAFADFDNPSTRYLRWRLAHRHLSAEIHNLDGNVPAGFDAAYAFDVIEHVGDPFALLAELERRAAIVVVNLLEPVPDDTPLHHALPIAEIIARAKARGLIRHRRFHGRSHLIAYRGATQPEVSSVSR